MIWSRGIPLKVFMAGIAALVLTALPTAGMAVAAPHNAGGAATLPLGMKVIGRLADGKPKLASASPTGLSPAAIASVYHLPGLSPSSGAGAGQVIAIVDFHDDPNALADLNKFSEQYGYPQLPECTSLAKSAPPCFEKAYPQGSSLAVATDLEESLDVEWAHAEAPAAKIVLVETAASSKQDLFGGVSYANRRLGATEVSMSWSFREFTGETSDDASYFTHPGTFYFAAAGDLGHEATYPAASPNVIAVGGTTLNGCHGTSCARFTSETAWSGSGGGRSALERIPGYQKDYKGPVFGGLSISAMTGGKRAIPDVSFDANRRVSGVSVYDSTPVNGQTGWFTTGGTSVGAPNWAGIVAAAVTEGSTALQGDSAIYSGGYATNLRDITSGKNGTCGVACTAGPGYDQITGLGSPLASPTSTWGKAIEVPGTAVLNTGGDGRILSVSCPSDGNCAAGGEYKDSSGEQAFVVNDANGTWGSAEEVPGSAALNTGGGAGIVTVSCASAGNCTAGGAYSDGAGYEHALIVSQVNGTWHNAAELPGVAALGTGGNSDVRSLSCASAGNCSASGFYWNGSAWQTFVAAEVHGTWHTAKGLAGTAVSFESNQSLSCPSAGNCSVGGGYQQPFVANEVNGTWGKAEKIPGIAALNTGKAAAVVSVSCTSLGNCSAGGYSDAGHKVFVVNEVNGTWGQAEQVPGTASLNAGGTATISSVSCASPGNCSAGGGWNLVGSGGVQAFAATEVNGTWGSAEEVPDIASLALGGASAISSLSCTLPGHCAAVGEYMDGTGGWQAFAVSEVDGAWGSAEEIPGTAALNVDEYAWPWAVSCAPVGDCTAGGEYRDSNNQAQAFVVSQPPNT